MNELRIHLGIQIRNARKSVGLTQPQLADKAKLSVNHLNRFERGKANISVDNLNSIAFALGLPTISLGETLSSHLQGLLIPKIAENLPKLSASDLQSLHRIVLLMCNADPNRESEKK